MQIYCSKCPDVTVPSVIAVVETVYAFVAAFAVLSVTEQFGAVIHGTLNVIAPDVEVVVHAPKLSVEPAAIVHVVPTGGLPPPATRCPVTVELFGRLND